MSELPEPYVITGVHTLPESYKVRCQACGAVLGVYEQHGHQTWIVLGNAHLAAVHGECACGEPWHYTAERRQLELLIARRVKAAAA